MLKLTQKTAVIDGKKIAFVEPVICHGNYTYKVNFDEKTKKRANAWFRSLGFRIGVVDSFENISDKVVEL